MAVGCVYVLYLCRMIWEDVIPAVCRNVESL